MQLKENTNYKCLYKTEEQGNLKEYKLIFNTGPLDYEHEVTIHTSYSPETANIPELVCTKYSFGTIVGDPQDTQDGYHFALILIETTMHQDKIVRKIHYAKVANEFLYYHKALVPNEQALDIQVILTRHRQDITLFGITTVPQFIGHTAKCDKSAFYTIVADEATFQIDPQVKNLYAGSLLIVRTTSAVPIQFEVGWNLTIEQTGRLSYLSPLVIMHDSLINSNHLHFLKWVSYNFNKAVLEGLADMVGMIPSLVPTLILPIQEFWKNRSWLWSYYIKGKNTEVERDARHFELVINLQIILPDNILVRASTAISSFWLVREYNNKAFDTVTMEELLNEVSLNIHKKQTSIMDRYNPTYAEVQELGGNRE